VTRQPSGYQNRSWAIRPSQDLHVPRRTPEPHDSDANAPHDAADERLQQEVVKPLGRVLPLVRLLQFLPDSPEVARDARDGSGDL
jgi:hypothetical protein